MDSSLRSDSGDDADEHIAGAQGFTSPTVTAVLSLRENVLAHRSLWQVTPFTCAGAQETSGSYKLNLYSGIHARAMSVPQVFCDTLPGCDRALPRALLHVRNMKVEKRM